jgi:hypothetical protein
MMSNLSLSLSPSHPTHIQKKTWESPADLEG